MPSPREPTSPRRVRDRVPSGKAPAMTCRSFFGALMPAAALWAAAATPAPAGAQGPATDMEVRCAAGRRFFLRADADRATIVWKDGQLTLERVALPLRYDERRVAQEWVRTSNPRWSPMQ